MTAPLRLGTRGSQLALVQAHTVAEHIRRGGGPACEIVVIKTTGDRVADAPLSEVGGKRLFVKEIEDALLRGDVDLAVHSTKDLPAVLPDGLTIGAALAREDPRDALVLPETSARVDTLEDTLAALGQTARVGSSSVRRVAQLVRLLPGARFEPIRGNLDTRLRKLDAGDYDVLVLASAGLRRLRFAHRISVALPVSACVPAPGQGAVAIEVRSDDRRIRQIVGRTNDEPTAAAIAAERALVAALGGGCQTPVGAVALPADDDLEMHAIVVSLDGERAVRRTERGPRHRPIELGERLARRLIEEGAREILAEAQRAQAAVEGLQP